MSRWITLNLLADETGLAVRTLQYIRAQEPGVLVTRQRGKALEYKQPDCAINLRTREVEKAIREQKPVATLDEARTRKALAEAELVEIEVAKARGAVVSVEDSAAAWGRALDVVIARLRAITARVSHLGTAVEAAVGDEVEATVVELQHFDQDVLDEPVIEEATAA